MARFENSGERAAGIAQRAFPADYVEREGVYYPAAADAQAFSYSDGDASENYLLELIAKAEDRSIFAPAMLAGIRDWPSRYHLSPKRANLLRPFSPLLRGDVLEVGAGCGAITRFLGENGGRIVAVEGSARRARIARHRTADLDNVRVVCDRIEGLAPSGSFDVITAIGVLEYAAVYAADRTNPHVAFLRCLRNLLATDGVVVLAIENRLGLKYFAGAREDHTGGPFDGINDGYRPSSVATFGAAELARLLDQSGLRSRVWFVPCPDYKLPTTVISASLLNRYPELAASLVAQAAPTDPQRPADPIFSLEQAWSVLGRNALLGELANSFLVVAGTTTEAVAPYQNLDELAWHYSIDRHPAFTKETRFVRAGGDLRVERHALTTAPRPDVPVRQVVESKPLRRGRNWWNELAAILNRPDWSVKQVADWARIWIDALVRECGVETLSGETFTRHVEGRHFDLAPFNMVRDAAGETHFFDQEWRLTPTVELGYLVVRGLRDSLLRVSSCAAPAADTPQGVNQLVVNVLAELGILVTRAEIDRYALMEDQVQAWVQGRAASGLSAEGAQARWNAMLRQRAPAERDRLARERQALQASLEQLRQQREQAEETRARLAAELTQAKAAAAQQAGEIDRLAALRDAHERALEEIGRDLQAADERARAVQSSLRESQGQTQRLAGELATAQEELARRVREHEAERARLLDAGKKHEEHAAALQQELDAAQSSLRESQGQTQYLAGELATAQEELARRVREHEAERARLLDAGKEREEHAAALQQDLDAAQSSLRESQGQTQHLAGELAAAQEELARRVREHEAERARLLDAGKKHEEHAAALDRELKSARAQLQDSETRLRTAVADRDAKLQALTADRDSKLRALTADRDAVRKDAARAATERDAASRQMAQLFTEVGTLQALKPRLEAETARAKRAEDEAARLSAELAAGRDALKRREQERDAQARDAQVAKAQSEQLRATLVRQALALEALAPAQGRSLKVAWRALVHRFARWKTADFAQKAWEADVIRNSRLFSALAYLKRYPDVAEAGCDPLLHYIRYGEAERRTAHPLFDAGYYLNQHPEVAEAKMTALAHYASAGVAAGFDPHPLFDTDWYLQQNPDAAQAGVNPLHHYMTQGWREGRDPHPLFDTSFYLEQNPDVAAAGVNPLHHYMTQGWREGRDPHPLFDTSWYLEKNRDVAEAGENPLIHYVHHGRAEGRPTHLSAGR